MTMYESAATYEQTEPIKLEAQWSRAFCTNCAPAEV